MGERKRASQPKSATAGEEIRDAYEEAREEAHIRVDREFDGW